MYTIKDTRLYSAYAAIDSGSVEVLSLDIFDTLLWRKLPAPIDLFLILGKRLKDEGWLIPGVTSENFAQLRFEAEQMARLHKEFALNTSEVTLREIYWQLCPLFTKITTEEMLTNSKKGVYETDVAELVKIELDLERNFLRLDESIAALLRQAKEKKIRVILVSDTYFEEHDLFYLLDSPYINTGENSLKQIDALFLSSEYGCSKEQGLFLKAIETLKAAPQKVLHIGDSKARDMLPALKAGLQAVHYPRYEAKFEEILDREWKQAFEKRQPLLDLKEGDFGISALRTKIMYHNDLTTLKREDQFYWKYGASILGPVLLGFVHWLYTRSEELGQNEVFCLMREGKLYAALLEKFAPCYPQHQIIAKKLWVSRLFIAHASLSLRSPQDLIAIMNAFLEEFTFENFCLYLGLDVEKMPKWSKYKHVHLEDRSLRKEFALYLLNNPSFRSTIVQGAAAKRGRFLKYLNTLTDISQPRLMTLVDIGWNGTTQTAIERIFRIADLPIPLHGLYLATTENANSDLLSGIIKEGYLLKGGHPPFGGAYKKGCFVLEQTATAETGLGPLHDIGEGGEIITSLVSIPAKQRRQAGIVQKGIFALFDLAAPLIQSGAISLNAHSEALQNQLRNIFNRSMLNTTQEEAVKFGNWMHEHGPAPNLTQFIGKNPYYETFIKDMLPIDAFKESGLNWLAAYTAKNSKYLTLMSQAMWLNTLPPRCFLSEDNFLFKIYVDTGGKLPKRATRQIQLRSNPNRRFFSSVQISSPKKPIRRIQLALAFPKSLVRIHSLRITLFNRQTPRSEQLIFFEGENSGVKTISGEKLNDNTFYCQEQLELVHSFEQSDLYQLKIKLCCEKFTTA